MKDYRKPNMEYKKMYRAVKIYQTQKQCVKLVQEQLLKFCKEEKIELNK